MKEIQSTIDKVNLIRAANRSKQIYVSPKLLKAMSVALFVKAALPKDETDVRSFAMRIGASVVSVETIVHPNHAKKVSIARPDNLVRARLETFTVAIPSDKQAMKALNASERKALALIQSLTYCRFVRNGTPTASDASNPDSLKVFLVRK
jgi:hypothetical protein